MVSATIIKFGALCTLFDLVYTTAHAEPTKARKGDFVKGEVVAYEETPPYLWKGAQVRGKISKLADAEIEDGQPLPEDDDMSLEWGL